MRTILRSHTAVGTGTPITVLSGDTLALVVSGAGSGTINLRYQSELAPGAPWVNVALNHSRTDIAFTTTQTGMVVLEGLPRGFYRADCTAWASGQKDTVLLAY
jgi:hypothetical protein